MNSTTITVALAAFFLFTDTGFADNAEVPTSSDFIDDLPTLEVHPNDPDLFRWVPPDDPRAGYTKLMITQPEIFLAKDNRYKGMQPDQLKIFADLVVHTIATRMSSTMDLVDTPWPGTLVLYTALTDLKMKRKRNPLGYLPLGAVVHAAAKNRDVATEEIAKKILMVNTRLEVEAVDGETGERIGINILVITRKQKGREEESWEALEEEVEDLADRFYKNYEEYRAETGTP